MSVNTDIRLPKIAELIAEQIQDDIAAGRLRAGDSLPSETAIMTSFGASRPPVREAIRILESDGLISVRRGSRGRHLGDPARPPDGGGQDTRRQQALGDGC